MAETEPPAALELRGIAKLYGRTAALRSTSLRVQPGECLVLLGPNGSGKTTLLKLVAGALSPTLGYGTVFGHDLHDRLALRPIVGLLAAESYLYDDLTAEENLRFILTMAGRSSEQVDLGAALDTVMLASHARERVRTFSSGMKRRLALARLILLRPQLVLLDEPYNSLDAQASDLVDDLIREWRRDGCAVLLATHDAARALALGDRAAALDRGSLTYLGSVQGYTMRYAQQVG